jgi:hypothetical protein
VDCPEEADHQRARYIASQLQSAIETIQAAGQDSANESQNEKDLENSVRQAQLTLARGRELFKSWSWLAERRLPKLFGLQNQQVNVAGDGITINIGLRQDGAAGRLSAPVDNPDAALLTVDNVIDGQSERP